MKKAKKSIRQKRMEEQMKEAKSLWRTLVSANTICAAVTASCVTAAVQKEKLRMERITRKLERVRAANLFNPVIR